ncbi:MULTISPECIES: hypothetical protein [unclassified Cupriavidus]|uniref:hypothetical protein n=1 Tax=Cupriavidus sp. H19C3 TaxID=3241603 RepID=UPI003BF81E65
MSRAVKAWRAVLVVKVRAVERANQAVQARRAELREREAAVAAARAARAQAQDRLDAGRRELARVLTSRDMAPASYLMHAAYLRYLEEELKAADQAIEVAERYRVSAQQKVDAALRALGRAETSRDTCQERLRALLDAAQRAAEAALDEEASETAAARLHARRARAPARPG